MMNPKGTRRSIHLVSVWVVFLFIACLIPVSSSADIIHSATPERVQETAIYQELHEDEFMTRWMILGPIPVFKGKPNPEDKEKQKQVFHTNFFEEHVFKPGFLNKIHRIDENDYSWKYFQTDNEVVDFKEAIGDTEFVVAYAWAEITVKEEKKVLIGLGSDDGVKVWLIW